MAMSGVYGLGRFGEYMAGLEEHYAVIGGTACDILLNASDLPFRATKDIDVVLMVEDRPAEVGRAIWKLLSDGGYAVARRGYGKRALLSLLETGRIRLSLDGRALRHRAELHHGARRP